MKSFGQTTAAVTLLILTPLAALARPLSCRSYERTFVATQTRSYWVTICGGDRPAYYMARHKQDPRLSIRLPLRDWSPQGYYFEAVNGEYTYLLTKTPQGIFLTVNRGTYELLREPVLEPW
ncbi:hypothetical protein [Thermosynechococcus vestitus]|uniref:Tlr1415 protein n=1 Tax=Thermosynechococcus vestitus (strain NIES-2133 / IAM M-273 / BP-1) TaxID=197221 RepID=Q8DJ16_THEVB|nr:hypothetical protein [Thermosynechococcus vestitus]BAC08967.1 tlr1415 [Thermosynechococcus vestitus BP-1]